MIKEETFTVKVTTYCDYVDPYEALMRMIADANDDMTLHIEIVEDDQ